MKICLPTMGDAGLKEKVHSHFGSANYFTVYDTENDQFEVIQNDNEHHSHGACQPLRALAGQKVDAVLTNGMGARAVNLLNADGVKVYILEGDTVEQAVQKFKAGELRELNSSDACQGHGCH